EQGDDRERHALAGGLGGRFDVGQPSQTQSLSLGRDGRAHPSAFRSGQRRTGGQLRQFGYADLSTEPPEACPWRLAKQASFHKGAAQLGKGPSLTSLGSSVERSIDSLATSEA